MRSLLEVQGNDAPSPVAETAMRHPGISRSINQGSSDSATSTKVVGFHQNARSSTQDPGSQGEVAMTAQGHTAPHEFTTQQWARVDEIVDRHRKEPGALIPVLEEVQEITGYVPEVVQRRIAQGLGIPLGSVYGVVTFYSYFTMKPRGRHEVRVCLGTACHVRGAQRNLAHIQDRLGIQPGECTEDREFSLDLVRCLGACGLAPVMLVDRDTHRQVKTTKLDGILYGYRTKTDR